MSRQAAANLAGENLLNGESPSMVFSEYCKKNNIQRTEIVDIVFYKCLREINEERGNE